MSSQTQDLGGPELDPVIIEAVRNVRDRFGAPGLQDLITLASQELREAEAALAELRDLGD